MVNLFSSVKNLRKHVISDPSSKRSVDLANRIKRTSYLAEFDIRLCIALNCKNYPTYDGSTYFNLLLDYIEHFFDKSDVVFDLLPYFRLLNPDDAAALRERVKSKIDALETGFSSIQTQA